LKVHLFSPQCWSFDPPFLQVWLQNSASWPSRRLEVGSAGCSISLSDRSGSLSYMLLACHPAWASRWFPLGWFSARVQAQTTGQ
jgi:hypothetical protein